MIKKVLISLLLVVTIVTFSTSQCSLNLLISEDSVLCGECITLSAFGSMDGNIAFEEDFNSGSPQGWQFTQSITLANNTCGVPAPDGSDFMWMGDASVNPRDMTTVPLDLSLGGSICFEMRYSVQSDASPCEGPDESDEGVYLQYSINNGTTWTDINYWDPNGGNDPMLTAWNQYCSNLPVAAQTTNTLIRWHQDDVSGANYDHWGIDNVQITLNDPNSQITWLHDNYNYPLGSAGGENPNEVCLSANTYYTAQITNGTNTCIDSILVPIKLPVVSVYAGPDSSVCPGDCIDLEGEAKVIISPAKTPTYANAETSVIVGTPGIPQLNITGDFSSDMNINIADLNQTSISAGSITSICITGFNISSVGGGTTSLAEAEIILTCPSGNSINLVNVGDLVGSQITNMCFDISGAAINTGSAPYSGTFAPAQPISNLNGCDANGLWNITIRGDNPDLALPLGGVDGWSISFDDPEISYPAVYSWSPTTNMTNPSTLTPTVCPTVASTYVLSATDSNNCVTSIDSVTIEIAACCNFNQSANISDPTCGNTDGAIDLTVTNGSGNYTYDWGANGTNEDLMNLASGSYTVSITDVTENCTEETTIIVTNSNDFTYTLTTSDPTCGNADGLIEINVTGGTAPFSYSFDNGLTFTPNNSANLPSGTYTVVVEDNGGCEQTFTETLTADCCNFNIAASVINTTCGENNGAINLTLTNTSGNESLLWSNGATTEDLNNLSAGNYNLTINSIGCSVNETYTVGNSNGVNSSFTATPQPTTISNSEVTFISQSSNASGFVWTIDNDTIANNDTLVYQFPSDSAGTYLVCLTAFNNICADSICKVILIDNDSVALIIPNVITPNNDGVNDLFRIIGIDENYDLTIFNRWGRKVKSFSPYKNDWDGTNEGGKNLSEGTYYYILENREDKSISYEGFLNLYR